MNKKFLDLGLQPLANRYLTIKEKKMNLKEEFYHLLVNFNTKTKLISLSKKVEIKKMFNSSYPYKSSMSKTMLKSFRILSEKIKKKFNPKMFLEIGSNDGALIKNFNNKKVIGIEPCKNLAKITRSKGYKTYCDYWNLKLANKIKKKYKKIDLIYSANTITHIEKLDEVFKSISHVLTKNGVIIIEDPSLLECIKKTSYDQFYNEHIYLFSALALKNILKKHNFEIFDITNLKTHGGSLRYFIKRKKNKNLSIKSNVKKQLKKEIDYGLGKFSTFRKFGESTLKSKKDLIRILNNIKKKNKRIIGYGATAKATTILNYCNIDNHLIEYFVDTTPDKKNKHMPGKKIKILSYDPKLIKNIDYIFLGAWNFKDEIFKKERLFIKNGGKFITHVPSPKIINK